MLQWDLGLEGNIYMSPNVCVMAEIAVVRAIVEVPIKDAVNRLSQAGSPIIIAPQIRYCSWPSFSLHSRIYLSDMPQELRTVCL
jgi:hypothetical protein